MPPAGHTHPKKKYKRLYRLNAKNLPHRALTLWGICGIIDTEIGRLRKRQSKARLESAATDMSELGKMQNRLKDFIKTMLILILLISFVLVLCILFIAIIILVCEFSLLIKIPLVLVLLSFVSMITFEALSILSCEWRKIRDYLKVVQTLKRQIDVDGFEKEDYKKSE